MGKRVNVDSVRGILRKYLDENSVKILTSSSSLDTWNKAFTHSSIDVSNNYEDLELLGDSIVGYLFMRYIFEVFPDSITKQTGTLLKHNYMSTEYQVKLSENMNLDSLIMAGDLKPIDRMKIKEDVFESFFGAVHSIGESYKPGAGILLCSKIFNGVIQTIDVSLSDAMDNPITVLKELFDLIPEYTAKGDKCVNESLNFYVYQIHKSKNPRSRHVTEKYKQKIAKIDKLIGKKFTASNVHLSVAKKEAAQKTLKALADIGVTKKQFETYQYETKERSEKELEHVVSRVKNYIEWVNSQYPDDPRIVDYDYARESQVKTQSENIYLSGYRLFFIYEDGEVSETYKCETKSQNPYMDCLKKIMDQLSPE